MFQLLHPILPTGARPRGGSFSGSKRDHINVIQYIHTGTYNYTKKENEFIKSCTYALAGMASFTVCTRLVYVYVRFFQSVLMGGAPHPRSLPRVSAPVCLWFVSPFFLSLSSFGRVFDAFQFSIVFSGRSTFHSLPKSKKRKRFGLIYSLFFSVFMRLLDFHC